MKEPDLRRQRRLRFNQVLILLMVAALLGGLLWSQWNLVLVNAVLL